MSAGLPWWTLRFRTPDGIVHWRRTTTPQRDVYGTMEISYGCTSPYHLMSAKCHVESPDTVITCLNCILSGPWNPERHHV